MPKAVRIHRTGGPEVLCYEEVEVAAPQPGEVQVRNRAIGLNFIDIYHRTGLYPLPCLPAVLGLEAAGVVEIPGQGVEEFRAGDRVAYASPPSGAYAEVRNIPADRVVALPDTLDDRRAAAIMLKGMTARYLLRRTFPVGPGHTILVHAAAGGVGLILCRWARHLGALVLGVVGSEEKAACAFDHGCHHPIVASHRDFVEEVRALTSGRGVDVVYDSVGQETFLRSLECLRPLGMMVSFGNASGPVPAVPPALLAQKGSLFLTRPTLMDYTRSREDLQETARDLFKALASGAVAAEVHQEWSLAEAAQAHRALESRRTTGSCLLLP